MKTLELYTDGSCQVATKDKDGTCSFVVVDKQNIIHTDARKYEDTTNNRMELMGCVLALEWIHQQKIGRAYIHTDSQYLQLGLTEWLPNWKKRNWKNANNKPVVNVDLWKQLDILKNKLPMVQFQWVRGHNNNKFNEVADNLCKEAYNQESEDSLQRKAIHESKPFISREEGSRLRRVHIQDVVSASWRKLESEPNEWNTPEAQEVIKEQLRSRVPEVSESDQLLLKWYKGSTEERINGVMVVQTYTYLKLKQLI